MESNLITLKRRKDLDPLEQHVIDFIHKLRLDNHMNQSDLGHIINTSTSFIGNVENRNNPSKYNLKHIHLFATYFGLSPKSFLP